MTEKLRIKVVQRVPAKVSIESDPYVPIDLTIDYGNKDDFHYYWRLIGGKSLLEIGFSPKTLRLKSISLKGYKLSSVFPNDIDKIEWLEGLPVADTDRWDSIESYSEHFMDTRDECIVFSKDSDIFIGLNQQEHMLGVIVNSKLSLLLDQDKCLSGFMLSNLGEDIVRNIVAMHSSQL